ncbi:unnamed protein product [Adineta ricciae]|nr:unnamed protein product [Adineta ricciae]
MTGNSVLYTKTDLTQICNKPTIRLEGVKRLVDSGLLTYKDHFWVEPSRSKNASKKNAKRMLRGGWIKNFPTSNTHAAKLEFIQLLQKMVDVTYEDYLKSFYPYQQENVFTANHWTLSDEFIQLMESNFFYKQYVRWNEQQFRPCVSIVNEISVESEAAASTSQIPHLNNCESTTNNNIQNISIQKQHDEKEELVHTYSQPVHRKRKATTNQNYCEERQTRTQTRKFKRN